MNCKLKEPIVVTCAVIFFDKSVLAVQRNTHMHHPLKWEFPGGKVKPFETPQECILREIKEELNIEIQITGTLQENLHHYEHISIRLIPFTAVYISGYIALSEHLQYKILPPELLLNLDWTEADIPIVKQLLK